MKNQKTSGGREAAPGFNYQMCLLSVIGICFIVIGHINFGNSNYDLTPMGTFHGWFPYYSFHLPIFLFITGYFFKDFSSQTGRSFGKSLGHMVLKKARTLLLPYYIINGIFLLGGTFLTRAGVSYLAPFTLERWLLYPWTKNYIITYSLPTWYMIALFVAEIYYVLLRKLVEMIFDVCRRHFGRSSASIQTDRKKNDISGSSCLQEIVLLLMALALGIAAVFMKNTMHPSEAATVYLRSVVMLFYIQLGLFYRKFLERRDTLQSGWYFLIVFALQFLIILLTGNSDLSPGLYALVNFDTFGVNYFLAGITGLALWLRITRLLASLPGRSKLLQFIGGNTKYIMSFHVFGFFVVNWIFSLLYKARIGMTLLQGFSERTWKGYLYYAHTDNPRMILLYFLGSLGFSLLVAWLIGLAKKGVHALHK